MNLSVALQLSVYGGEPASQRLVYARDFKEDQSKTTIEVHGEEIVIGGDTYQLSLSFSFKNSGLSLCITKGEKMVVRYGGLLKGSSNVGISLGGPNLLDVILALH